MHIEFSLLRTFQIYQCVSFHYKDTYDIEKYGFGGKQFPTSPLEKYRSMFRKLYEKCINEKQLIDLLSIGFFWRNYTWIGEVIENYDTIRAQYLNQQKILCAPVYQVKNELNEVLTKHSFQSIMNDPSLFSTLIMSDQISPETVCLAQQSFGFLSMVKDDGSSYIFNPIKKNLTKYNAYIKVSDDVRKQVKVVCRSAIEASIRPTSEEV